MQNPRLASRYAKSLLDLAVEQNNLDPVLQDMLLLNQICSSNREFDVMLRSPVIKGDKKLAVIQAVVKDSFHQLTLSFIKLMVAKGRELNLGEIVTAFIAQYNDLKKIRTVRLTTATPVDEAAKKNLVSRITGFAADETIHLETKVDSSLIGGFVLEAGDKLFDASVKKQLHDLRSAVVDNSYVAKM